MGAWTLYKFNSFAERVREDINLETDEFEFTLQTVSPDPTSAVWADESANELADGDGYSGQAVSTTSSQTGGNFTLATDAAIQLTASGGNIGPAQYCIIRNMTLTGEPLCLYGIRDTALQIDDGAPAATIIPSSTNLYTSP